MVRSIARRVLERLRLLRVVRGLIHHDETHGHSLLMRLLPSVARTGAIGYVIEVGTTREKLRGQGSTVLLARMAKKLGLSFITVDMDPANTAQASIDLKKYRDANAITAKGEEFLASFSKPVMAAYLDAFDIDHGAHSSYRIDRYRRFLAKEITDDASHEMHLACARALIPLVIPGGLVVIDDTWPVGDAFAGKGATAVPELLRSGFVIADRTPTALALARASVVS